MIKNAQDVKEQAEIASEKEILETSIISVMEKNKKGELKEDFKKELNNKVGEGKTEVYDLGEKFGVIFIDSNRYYEIDEDGNVGDVQTAKEKDNYPGDITKDMDGNTLDGSAEKPYEINCIEDLVALSNITNGEGYKLEDGKTIEITSANVLMAKDVVLKKTLNFKSPLSYADCKRTDFGDINGNTEDGNELINELTTGEGFKPIGAASNGFQGNFDGLGNKIEEIYIDRQDVNVGLFSMLCSVSYDITIQNLGISGEMKVNEESGCSVGGIAGWISSTGSYNVEISNCYNLANITANSGGSSGGIAGGGKVVTVVIKNCYNLGDITNNKPIGFGGTGGIYGFAYSPVTFKNCYNTGNVTSVGFTGGIVGYSYHHVDFFNCYNVGNSLIGDTNVGGISGIDGWKTHNYINCYNMADKMEGTTIGGLSGYSPSVDYIIVTNCFYDKNLAQNGIQNWTEVVGNGIEIAKINTAEIVKQLNDYIEKGTENAEGIDTSDWKKWKIGEEGYPIFE